jgi:hypothetical protein
MKGARLSAEPKGVGVSTSGTGAMNVPAVVFQCKTLDNLQNVSSRTVAWHIEGIMVANGDTL